MKVSIKGGLKRQRDAINEMVYWVGRQLLSRRLYAATILNIELKNLDKEDYKACTNVCPEYYASRRPRAFDLEFDKSKKLDEIREDLCHEMVHVKQFERGELYRYDQHEHIRWKDKIYHTSIEDGIEYWSLPYEIEARGHEKALRMKFREYLKTRGKRKCASTQ